MRDGLKGVLIGAMALAGVGFGLREAQALPIRPPNSASSDTGIERVFLRYGYGYRRPFLGYRYGFRRPFVYGYRRF